MAEALQSLIDDDERIKSQDDLANMIGKDKGWVSGMLRILTLPVELQQKVARAQLSISYDSIIRISRLDDAKQQTKLVESLLNGAGRREIHEQIDQIKGTKKPDGPAKPKKVYHTRYKATVIVQATTGQLSQDQCIEAIQEALGQAVNGQSPSH